MVQLSPDTQIKPRKEAYGWAAGYRHDDSTIVGFSHTHFSGTGHSDLGDVLLMPVSGEAKLERGDPDVPGSGYTSRFSHDTERAEPGYYAVTLRDGRYVIPVRREGRGSVGGIVHGASASGATLFVEPPAAVEFGNRIRELEAEERAEREERAAAGIKTPWWRGRWR